MTTKFRLQTCKAFAGGIFCLLAAIAVLIQPKTAAMGVSRGIQCCINQIIPSLFPFLFLSALLIQSRLPQKIGRLLQKPVAFLFHQNGEASCIIFLSMVGGIPVGAGMALQEYENGDISKEQAVHLCYFCINAGPAFIIGAVGNGMLHSTQAGVILYICVVCANLLIGILTRFTFKDPCIQSHKPNLSLYTPSEWLHTAVQKSIISLANCCAWIVLFSCFLTLLLPENCPTIVKTILCCLLELTSGCENAVGYIPTELLAGVLAWCGLCAHLQIIPCLSKIGIKKTMFVFTRLLSAGIAVLLCKIAFHFFPLHTSVGSMFARPQLNAFSAGAPVSAGLLMMCAFILLGNKTTIQIHKSLKKDE